MIPAVSYLRMSTDKQEASIPAQRTKVEAYARKHAYKIIREYLDSGISGDDTEKRVEFRKMLADASGLGDFEVILCWDQDRFGRFDPLEAGYWIKPLQEPALELIPINPSLGNGYETDARVSRLWFRAAPGFPSNVDGRFRSFPSTC